MGFPRSGTRAPLSAWCWLQRATRLLSQGSSISGLDGEWPATTKVFHAGTRAEGDDTVTSGGRVLWHALGDSIAEAIGAAYTGVDRINWEG